MESLATACRSVLETANARDKAAIARKVAEAWRLGRLMRDETAPDTWPDRPKRPEKPELLEPREMPRRKISGTNGRKAQLHALAHIELNAIDLAFDLVGRFVDAPLPDGFIDDWIKVGADEARHFLMLADRLADFDMAYGDLPAHDGLWQAAFDTRHDLLARLAVVPLVLEARGLDVTPTMMQKFESADDKQSALMLKVIYEDEKTDRKPNKTVPPARADSPRWRSREELLEVHEGAVSPEVIAAAQPSARQSVDSRDSQLQEAYHFELLTVTHILAFDFAKRFHFFKI